MKKENNIKGRKGFTVIEIVVAMAIMCSTLAMALYGWLYVLRGERMTSIQNELDIDVRISMERIKKDLRLSSMDKVFYWPPGPGPYTAISFPMARDDDGDGLIELDADSKIMWDKTVVYHVWESTPNELRITTFDPRDNTLTDAQRQEQINSVATYGNGASTYNGSNAKTIKLFANLFDWKVIGKGNQVDAYKNTLQQRASVPFGTLLLGPGAHYFKFAVLGKNPASSDYKVGLDSLVVSPCQSSREAEAQLPVYAESGAAAVAEYMAGGSWGGNSHLAFPATAVGDSFTLAVVNDRWEETNFRNTGVLCEDTQVNFDTSLTPKDFVLTMRGATNGWQADWQTKDEYWHYTAAGQLTGTAVRIPIRGQQQPDGGGILWDGPLHCIWFYASAYAPLQIQSAYIAEAKDPTNYLSPDTVDAGVQLLVGGSSSFTIPAGGYKNALPASPIYIHKEKSYFISFLVGWYGGARYWSELTPMSPIPPGCFIIPGTNSPTLADVTAAKWSAKTNVLSQSVLYAVDHLHCSPPTNGFFTSQIFDTHLDAPAYTEISWHAEQPAGTDVRFKVRSGDQPDLSDAPVWDALGWITASGSPLISVAARRYCQFQSRLQSYGIGAGAVVPSLKDVSIAWEGESKMCDIAGTITEGPNYGIFQVTVDGSNTLKRGVTVDLTIYEDIRSLSGVGSNRLTSSLTVEVEPRNTGK